MQLNDLRVDLTLDNEGFRLSVRDSDRLLRTFEQRLDNTAKSVTRMEHSMTSVGAKAHRMVMTLGMARFALMDLNDIFLSLPRAILRTSGEVERMTKLMEGLSRETDETKRKLEAASNVRFVFNMAQNAPFEVKALTDAFVKFKSAGLDPTDGSMKSLVNAVAKFGGSSEQLHRASIAFQQMAGKGVISMEELRQQLGEAVPTAMASMARGMRMTMDELADAVSKGTVKSISALQKMTIIMGLDAKGAAADMMNTWTGMLERLKTKWELFKLDAGSSGFFNSAKGTLREIIDAFDTETAENFAQEIGTSINTVLRTLISLVKTTREWWEEIKTAGMILLTYWGASKVRNILSPFVGMVGQMRESMRNMHTEALAQSNLEARSRIAGIEAEKRNFETRIKNNERLISSERAAMAERARLANVALENEMRNNSAILAAHRARLAELQMMEREARNNALAFDVEADAARTAKRKSSDLVMLAEHERTLAGDYSRQAAALRANVQAMEARNRALDYSILRNNANANSNNATITSLNQKNNALRQVIAQYDAMARSITASGTAMNIMRGIGTTVISTLGSLLTPLNILTAAIMYGAYAWERYSERARQAARDAVAAAELDDAIREGRVSKAEVESSKTAVANARKELAELEEARRKEMAERETARPAAFAIGMVSDTLENFYKERDENYNAKRARLLEQIQKNEQGLPGAEEALIKSQAKIRADRIVEAIDESSAKEVRRIENQRLTAEKAVQDAIAGANKSKNAELATKLTEQLKDQNIAFAQTQKRAEIATLRKGIADIDAKPEANTKANRANYLAQLEARKKLEELILQKELEISRLESPNDMRPPKGKDKSGSENKLDAVLRALASEEVKVVKLENVLENMLAGTVGLPKLKEQVNEEIDALIRGDVDKGVTQRHDEDDRKRLADLMLKEKILGEIKNRYGSIRNSYESMREDFVNVNEMLMTGNFNLKQRTQSMRSLDELRALKDRFKELPAVATEIQKYIVDAEDAVRRESFINSGRAVIENEKTLAGLRIAVKTDERERMRAEHVRELDDLDKKYEAEIAAANGVQETITRIIAQHAEHRSLLLEQQAEKMKTPLEKLADSWARSTANMEKATESWAQSGMDAITRFITTGKGGFSDLVKSILSDMVRLQLQENLGKPMTQLAKMGGDWAMRTVMGKVGSAPAVDETVVDGLTRRLDVMGGATEKASQAIGTSMTNAIGQSVASTTQQIATGATKMSAEQLATSALATLTAAANAAAAALSAVAGGKAGAAIGGLPGIGGGFNVAGQAGSFGLTEAELLAAFANGGIMSSFGPVALRKYANGGIADRPQLALFGEGAMNEAYVPLPDGRRIPVALQGNAGATGAAPQVTVNVINQSGQQVNAQQGQTRFDGKQMVLDVVLTGVNTPGPFRDAMRQAVK